jgi:beta-aspartyl-dipeptidase (metallo-type)
MLALIQGGAVQEGGEWRARDVLIAGETIAAIGDVPVDWIARSPARVSTIDARDCLLAPGLIDGHEHLIGAGGERGFASRTTEVSARELAAAGITTVVGCLGTDGVTRTLSALVGKVRQLRAEGISAYAYTGGFALPLRTITGSITDDIVLVDPIIGVGELAIADVRASPPAIATVAAVASAAYVGGRLAGKAGLTHFHVGPSRRRLEAIRRLLDDFDVEPASLQVTHVNRSDELLREAAALSRRGVWIDIDCVDHDVGPWLRRYRDCEGDWSRLTLSSDANTPGSSPANLLREIAAAVRRHGFDVRDVLPLVTEHPARALKLADRGRIAVGQRADVVALRPEDLQPQWTMMGGALFGQGGGAA